MVGICCVFDFLDGLVARALNVHSEIGKQLDSLADMVSFGVVPGVMMFILINPKNISYEQMTIAYDGNLIASYFAFIIPIFSAIRLAKFNLDTRQRDQFIGLPTPANAILVASLFILFYQWGPMNIWKDYFLFSTTIFEQLQIIFWSFLSSWKMLLCLVFFQSFLLIAPLRLFALKFKNFSWANNKVRYIFLALALALLIIFKFVGIPLIIILYIILSIINNIIAKKSS